LSAAVHEINNPLDAVLHLLYLIESEPNLSDESRKYLLMAREEVLRISHIAQGAMKQLQKREPAIPTDVRDLLRSVLDLFRTEFHSRNIEVQHRLNGDLALVIRPGQMRQVFSNLILNAIDAMPEGGKLHARVSKSKEWAGAGRKGLRVTIADTGEGIFPENLRRVQEPFFTTKGAQGNGMGLAVVQEIIEQHSGVLKIRSSVRSGKSGTVLSIFLPEETAAA
jgi:signal transduction histidine kinase